MKRRLILAAVFLLAFAASAQAWEEVQDLAFEERGDAPGLLMALDRQAAYLEAHQGEGARVGSLRTTNAELLRGVRLFQKIVKESLGKPDFSRKVSEAFRVYRTSHPDFPGKAHFTAYYDPVMDASRHPNGPYRWAIYGRPPELSDQNGRMYFSREEIEKGGALAGKGLEIAWVADYVELHFLHIQGSGILHFTDGTQKTLHVAGTNGRAFKSPGKMLADAGVVRGGYQDVKNFLRGHPDIAQKYLMQNPRFIFFRLDEEPPSGCEGIAITPGRSIATDKSIYSAGAIGYVRYDAPKLDPSGNVTGAVSTSRFVTDNDTGAAITGTGRADLYVGNGPRAEALAGATNTKGELYYLIAR